MNERIRELAEQAGYEYGSYDPYGLFDKEKFAELIVRECADLCLKHTEYEGPFNAMEYRKGQHFNTIIKQHFGVSDE